MCTFLYDKMLYNILPDAPISPKNILHKSLQEINLWSFLCVYGKHQNCKDVPLKTRLA